METRTTPATRDHKRARVLVVDDSASTRLIVEEVLTSQNHVVTSLGSGAEALIECQAGSYDVVVLDLGLPDTDGMEVCRRLRQFSDVYILILTGRTAERDRVDGLLQGADDYMVKPFSPSELAARVETLMRRPRSATGTGDDVVFGEIRLHRSTRQMSVAGRDVALTKTEFKMVEQLTAKAPGVVTREELAVACWGNTGYGDNHLVSVHIANLRKKIDAEDLHLVTVRGVGYRLTTEVSHHS